jgi:hypothetical protein
VVTDYGGRWCILFVRRDDICSWPNLPPISFNMLLGTWAAGVVHFHGTRRELGTTAMVGGIETKMRVYAFSDVVQLAIPAIVIPGGQNMNDGSAVISLNFVC